MLAHDPSGSWSSHSGNGRVSCPLEGAREGSGRRAIVSEVLVAFKVAAALGTGMLCAAVLSCSSGPARTASTQAPPVTVLTKGADNGNGDVFLAPQADQYDTGPEIVSITGKVLWFHRLPTG